MSKNITKILLLILMSFGLHAGDGLSQEHLVSVSPEALAADVMCYPNFRQVPLNITQLFDILAS